jgi:hypothetical protein
MRDNVHNLAFRVAIAPPATAVADNTPMVGNWIDRSGFESLTFGITTGALASGAATFTVLVEDADAADHSDAAAVPDVGLISSVAGVAPEAAAGFTFADHNVTKKIGYIGNKQFARITITPAANASAAPITAVAVLGHANLRPVA